MVAKTIKMPRGLVRKLKLSGHIFFSRYVPRATSNESRKKNLASEEGNEHSLHLLGVVIQVIAEKLEFMKFRAVRVCTVKQSHNRVCVAGFFNSPLLPLSSVPIICYHRHIDR